MLETAIPKENNCQQIAFQCPPLLKFQFSFRVAESFIVFIWESLTFEKQFEGELVDTYKLGPLFWFSSPNPARWELFDNISVILVACWKQNSKGFKPMPVESELYWFDITKIKFV